MFLDHKKDEAKKCHVQMPAHKAVKQVKERSAAELFEALSSYDGGMFTVTEEMVNFMECFIDGMPYAD